MSNQNDIIESIKKLSKYEKAKIAGVWAYPLMMQGKIKKGEDFLGVIDKLIETGKLPLIIERTMPDGKKEKIHISEMNVD